MKKTIVFLSVFVLLLTSCTETEKKLSDADKKEYILKGKEIAKVTFKKMGTEVKKHMKEGGVGKAAPYCNANADQLTKDLAMQYNVSIKRTSDKLRNVENKLDTNEKIILDTYDDNLRKGEKVGPLVQLDEQGIKHFFAPILLQKKCLACHGVIGETMKQEADSIIKTLYPEDKATGYQDGDLRGIWHISFKE